MNSVYRLPKGFWTSAEGQNILARYRARESSIDELAEETGITKAAIYQAASKYRPGLVTSQKTLEERVQMDQMIQVAEGILGQSITTRIRQLKKENKDLKKQIEELAGKLESASNTIREQGTTLNSLQQRLAERILRTAGPAKPD